MVNLLSHTTRIALLLFLTATVCGAAQKTPSAPQAAHTPAPRITVVGIPNFAKVSPKLYRGGQPHGAAYAKLKQMGVDIVVDVRLSGKEREKKAVTDAGMRFVALPWHCMRPKDEIFARFLRLLRENPGKKVFVHCRYGDDRTGMMIAAYRMAAEGWTRQEAREEMNKFGFHHYVCASLVRYENHFPERLMSGAAFEYWRSQSGPPF